MMSYFKAYAWLVIIQTLPVFLCCCAVHQEKKEYYYNIPTVSYLRECPAYDCQVVTEIYNADKVKLVGKNDTGWWQVQSARDQKTGWIQPELLSDNPIIPENYYVTVEALPLRSSPSSDIVSRKMLGYGDEVQKLGEKDGWWRVLAEKDKAIGWIPAKMVSETRPEPLGKPPETDEVTSETQPSSKTSYYFVASENVKLYLIPTNFSQVVKVLNLNDKVVKISESGTAWIKVRYLSTGAEGWAAARYFKTSPVTDKKQIVTDKKKLRKKASFPKQKTQSPLDTESLEPEGM
jgi:uncharacterized protein YgiM (DUF1202 family)